jgi:hypothetical protein
LFRRRPQPEPDDRDEQIQALAETIAKAIHWNEHNLGMHSPYLGAQLNSILTGEPIQIGFQFTKDDES